MSDKEMKDFDQDTLKSNLFRLSIMLEWVKTEAESQEQIEKLSLQLATKFLRTNYFHKKRKGLNDLKLLIDRVDAKA